MAYTMEEYQAAAQAIRARLDAQLGTGWAPEFLLILGSGLGALGDEVSTAVRVPYGEIPGFCPSTAPGHAGQLVLGSLAGRRVAVMQGRLHYYEGYTMEALTFPVRVLRLLGCHTLFVTNAAGCVNHSWHAGNLMLISDHIKLAWDSPLRGPNLPELGERFTDCTELYTPELRELAKACAERLGLILREGVYLYMSGPQYETPAEIRAARTLGADAVGMSTVPEVLAAAHCGMRVLGLSLLANMAAGMLPRKKLSEQEVLDAAEAAKTEFSALILACLKGA